MFKKIIKAIAKKLDEIGLDYMIIGGYASILYGEPRITRDIDITVGTGVYRLNDILTLAESLSLKPLIEDIENFVKQTMVLPLLEESGIRIDFIFSFTPYEKEALKRVNIIMLDDIPVRFASAEDVIIHKIFAGRPRDIEDVKSIILKNPIDTEYIKKWLHEFEKTFPEGNFVKTFENILNELRT